jgi:activator of HSP90 ATPase
MRTINQTYRFPVEPKRVFAAFLNSKEHSDFTGAKASIRPAKGARFTAWDGYIKGKNLTIVPYKKIVQEWTCADFPDGHMSKITLLLSPVKTGTKLEFTHEGVPPENYASIKQGWIDNYWKLMREYFLQQG